MVRRRRRVAPKAVAPWPLLVIDSGGLTQLAARNAEARAALDLTSRAGAPALLPTIVLAESTRGDATDAQVNQIAKGLTLVPVDEEIARLAARLKSRAGLAGVQHTIDAIVVATTAVAGGGAILTTDPGDIQALASVIHHVRIRAIAV